MSRTACATNTGMTISVMAQFTYAGIAERRSIVTVTFGGLAVFLNMSRHAVMMWQDRRHGMTLRNARGNDDYRK
ncbi:hypothetical protein ACWMQ4_001036 [Salmonella enterica subsp. enterica serovar Montevideo]